MLILEDVAYREMPLRGRRRCRALWSLGPDIVLQAGTFSKIFSPGVRLGWAAGPRDVIAQLAARQADRPTSARARSASGSSRSTGAPGSSSARVPAARELYASHWRARRAARCASTCPTGVSWSEPTGGFFTWLTLPTGSTRWICRTAAIEAGVTYVPGLAVLRRATARATRLRLSFSLLGEDDLETAVVRLSTLF